MSVGEVVFRSPALPVRLRLAREQAGLSLRQLADAAGIHSHQTVAFVEDGTQRASLEQVERLAHALGVASSWLAFGDLKTAEASS